MNKGVCLPDDLAGIDINVGIKRVSGNQDLYITLLRKFIQYHRKDDQIIAQAIIQNDIPLAHRTAHTLKGVAGGIGAQALYDSSREVETELKKNRLARLDPLMENLVRDLTQVVEDLEQKIMVKPLDDTEKINTGPMDIKKITGLLDDFQRLAENMDPDMDRIAREINQLLDLHDSPFKKISVLLLDYAENLDFEDALETMETLKKILNDPEPS